MKRSIWVRLIAVILIISMLAAPVSAAPKRDNETVRTTGLVGFIVDIIRDIIADIFDDWFDKPGEEEPAPTDPIETTTPTTPGETQPGETEPTNPGETQPGETEPTNPGETQPGETDPTNPGETEPGETEPEEESPETELNLVEGHANTKNGHLLRGVTYSLSQVIAQQSDPLRATTAQKGQPLTSPFGNQSKTAPYALLSSGVSTFAAAPSVQPLAAGDTITSDTPLTITYDENGNAIIPNGDYVVRHYEGVGSYLTVNSNTSNDWGAKAITGAMQKANASYLTFTRLDDGTYTIQGPGKWYLTIPQNNTAYTQSSSVAIEIKAHSDGRGVTLKDTNSTKYLNALDYVNQYPKGKSYFGGWTEGSPFELYTVITEVDLDLSVTARYMTNRLSWNAQSGVTYNVERSEDNATWTFLEASTTGSYLDETAGMGTRYYYRVTTDKTFTAGVQGLTTGMNALKEIAVLFYEGNDKITFDGSNKVAIAEGDKANELNSLVSGTIIYKAHFNSTSGTQAVMGTDNGKFVGLRDGKFRHELGNLSGQHDSASVVAGRDNTAGFTYNDSNGYWFMSSNGSTMTPIDLDEANFGLMTDVGAATYYYAGGSSNSNHNFNGTINYIMVLSEILTNAELTALTRTNADHDAEAVELVYFPVTMFNYDTNAMNIATHVVELSQARADNSELTLWNGMYFSNGTPSAGYTGPTGEYTETTTTTVTYELVVPTFDDNGNINNLDTESEYILINKRLNKPVVDAGDTLPEGTAISGVGNSTLTYEYAEGADVTEIGNASIWKYGTYTTTSILITNTYPCIKNASGDFMTIGSETASVGSSNAATYIQRWEPSNTNIANPNCVVLKQGSYYLSDYKGGALTRFAGYSVYEDGGNPFFIYKKVSTVTETKQVPVTGSFEQGYANHNSWHKNTNQKANGDLFYTGLAAEFLRSNGNIIFTVPEGGIFSYDSSKLSEENGYYDGVKNVYEYVGMPFVINDTEGYVKYTFDSDANGVYFKDNNNDGTPDPAPGTPTQYNNLYINKGVPQPLPTDLSVGDGSRNGWFPYNITTSNKNDLIYHFGMRADLPFSMTANGCVKETDDTSDPITFNFSGDDDVWIYIDGKLVVDLGGIHNRFDISINFAENTVTYSENTPADTVAGNAENNETGSFNDPTFATTQKLFKESESDTDALLDITRQEFASSENHTMQFFYLERGAGTSNCMIEFNLPMRDTLLVTKDATQSWSAELQKDDEEKENGGDGTRNLTPEEQAAVDKLLFGFTLYKLEGSYFDENGEPIEDPDFVPVANTGFFILDTTGNIVGNGDTDEFGHFYLHNGQTAKFMTDMPRDGVTYYLVEDQLPPGFLTPDYQYAGQATHGFEYTGTKMKPITGETEEVPRTEVSDASQIGEHELPMDAEENKSYIITAKGSIESRDSLQFFCINYLEHNDDPVDAYANEDMIVIDYGLPVNIDPLANDIIRGQFIESVEIVDVVVGDHDFDIDGVDGITADEVTELTRPESGEKLTFTGHSGTFTLNPAGESESAVRDTFTYTLNKQLTEVEILTYLIKATARTSEVGVETASVYSQAKLYVIPATFMYYEENFNDLVEFTFNNGANAPTVMLEESYVSPHQEPGVVGDINNSTYGSDVAYKEDSHDSNGTSFFFDTTKGWVRFNYTFTGTGTTFFARTSATTGYMQVLVFEGDKVGAAGEQIRTSYRDTYFYKDDKDYEKDHDGEPLYNIPVYTTDDLPYGTYTVLVTVATKGTATAGPMNPEKNNMNYSMHEFYLDGIRVMEPLKGVYEEGVGELSPISPDDRTPITNKAVGAYATDGESNLEIATLRDKILEEFTPEYDADNGQEEPDWPFAILTDTNKNIIKASEYEARGPKEEVYLADADAAGMSNAQTVSFSLKLWEPDGLKLYMGMKAPFGNAQVKVGNHTQRLQNATDYYYDVTDKYASRVTKYEQLCDENGQLLYTDPEGKQVYQYIDEDENVSYWYVENDDPVDEGTVLTPIDDTEQPYILVTYTFEAVEKIVSLTNIKIVGSYQFTILENEDITVPGTDNGGN